MLPEQSLTNVNALKRDSARTTVAQVVLFMQERSRRLVAQIEGEIRSYNICRAIAINIRTQKQTIKHRIKTLADAVCSNGDLFLHNRRTNQKDRSLVHAGGKPLFGGRVVGEVLTREEVEQMPIVRQVLESVIALA